MRIFIISVIFAVLGMQSALASETITQCHYKGNDGRSATLRMDKELNVTGEAIETMGDGTELEFPVSGKVSLGDKEGYLAVILVWGTGFSTYTAALPSMATQGMDIPVYKISSFNGQGPIAIESGVLNCKE